MEPVGLTIGLTSLFTTSLEVFNRISSASTYGEDYHLFETKVSTERARFFLWGQAVGFTGSSEPHELLQDPIVQHEVKKLLEWAIYFFENSEAMREQHRPTRGLIAFLPGRNATTSMALDYPCGNVVMLQKKASTIGKVKWVFSGKRKCEKLLHEISWFVDKLHELIPTSGIQQSRPEQLPPTVTTLSSQSSAIQSRIEARRLQSSIRRMRTKQARRVAVVAVRQPRKIGKDDRYNTLPSRDIESLDTDQ